MLGMTLTEWVIVFGIIFLISIPIIIACFIGYLIMNSEYYKKRQKYQSETLVSNITLKDLYEILSSILLGLFFISLILKQ